MSNAEIRGRFVWHELMTTDTDAATDFYSHVVPWKTQDSGMPSYTLWMSGKYRAGGLMALPDGNGTATPPHWLVYVGTPDVDATAAAARGLGGNVLKEPEDIPNVGRFAVLSDPQGAAFAVFKPHPGPGDDMPPGGAIGDFTWHELATTDLDAALGFYTELFGWSKGAAHDMGGEMGVYQLISHGGQDVGGVYKVRDSSTPPNWLSYVQVADASKAANAAKSNGGRILNGPMEVPGGSWIAMMVDPQGGAFAVVEQAKTAKARAQKPPAGKAAPASAVAAAAPKKRAKKAPAKKAATAKAAPARKSAAKKAPAKKTAAKAAGKKAGKTPAKKAPAKKAPAKKAARKPITKPGKAAAKKSARPAAKKAGKKSAARKSAAPKKGATAKRKK
jgi:predicted enzyme related to lactoylglutathione lyase